MYNFVVHRMLDVPHKLHTVDNPANKQMLVTFVFLHGIGSSYKMWNRTIAELRNQSKFDHANFIGVDLLGFGSSPKPEWATYDIARQVRSLRRTLRPITREGSVVIVGHSLGALIAVEYAAEYPGDVSQLVLCSPPFYRKNPPRMSPKGMILQRTYEEIAKRPEISEKVLLALKRYTLVNEGYSIDESNAPIFIRTLKSSIMNQNAYEDALQLSIPTIILSGLLDPVVIERNITTLAKQNQHIRQKRIALAAHEINPVYRKELVKTLSTDVLREL